MKVKANKYGAGKYKVIVNDDAERITTGCCCCYLDIRSVTATLPLYGYNEFECEGLEPTGKKYLKFQTNGKGKIAWCGNFFAQEPVGIWTEVGQAWEINPFTGGVCYTGEDAGRVLRPCNTLASCTEKLKVYSCGIIPATGNCPEQELVWQEELFNDYDLTKLAQNVDQMFNRVKGSVWDEVPAGSHAAIVNGSNDSIFAVGGCAINIASYKFDEVNQEITKTKLFVKFTRNTTYRLREKSGSTETMSAPIYAVKGEELIINPENEGDEIEIYIEQKERKKSRPIYVSQDHKGNKTTRNLQMESGQLYESPLCEFFNKQTLKYEFSESVGYNWSSETSNKIITEDEDLVDGDNEVWLGNFNSTREESVMTTQAPGVADTIERTKNVLSNYNQTYTYEARNYYPPPSDVGSVHRYTETRFENNVVNITTSNEDGSDGPGTWSSTNTYTFERFWPTPSSNEPETTTNSGVGYNYDSGFSISKRSWWDNFGISNSWGCESTSWSGQLELMEGTRTYNGTKSLQVSVSENEASIVKNWTGSSFYLYNETSSGGGTEWNRSAEGTYNGTESLMVTYEMVGEWTTETEPNQDFIALKYKDPILEKEQDVNVDLELSFVAENSSEPITYDHWLHYYKKIDANPTGNCVFVEVEAQNIKWTTTSTGGAESETRNITLEVPTEIAIGRIENLYYQVTRKIDEA